MLGLLAVPRILTNPNSESPALGAVIFAELASCAPAGRLAIRANASTTLPKISHLVERSANFQTRIVRRNSCDKYRVCKPVESISSAGNVQGCVVFVPLTLNPSPTRGEGL